MHEVSKNIRLRVSSAKNEVRKHAADISIDTLMTGGTSDIRRRELNCPDKLSLVGFDDAEWMQATHPDIAAVAQPVDDTAEHAFALLMCRLQGFTGAPVSQLLGCRFLARSSIVDRRAARQSTDNNRLSKRKRKSNEKDQDK